MIGHLPSLLLMSQPISSRPTRAPRRSSLALAALLSLLTFQVPKASARPMPVEINLHRTGETTLATLFHQTLLKAKKQRKRVIVLFGADWCAPCKALNTMIHESGVIHRALRRGLIVHIDVDEWRGPAHRLIPGVNPRRLPTVARVDDAGRLVQRCYGTDLGLLSEDAVADGLKDLIAGKRPRSPFYSNKPKLERTLMLKQHDANEAKMKGVPELEVRTIRRYRGGRVVQIIIRNHDGPRRWYGLPARLDVPMSDTPSAGRLERVRFDDHVRATFWRVHGSPAFVAIPVAGYGSVTLGNWHLQGEPIGGKIEVWQLRSFLIDGVAPPFQKKLPYHLKLKDASAQTVLSTDSSRKLELTVSKRLQAAL